jgi:GNAT superfamily N-acetyltransferase
LQVIASKPSSSPVEEYEGAIANLARCDNHAMPQPQWSLRPAAGDDRDFLFDLHRLTMRSYVEATWEWDDRAQEVLFDESFAPERSRIIQVAGEDAGVLRVEESEQEIWLELIEIHPRWQRAGIGTSVVQSLLQRGAETGRPVSLRVLRTNTSARSLYERLGFVSVSETEVRTYFRADPPAA